MQETKKRLFALALALWGFSSCSQDASDVHGSATGGETVTFSLNAEVSVDDEQPRAIDYKLGNNAQGQLVPMPQFTDGQEVEVHTIIKNNRGDAPTVETLKWVYDATKKKLLLRQESHTIVIENFNNDSGTKWYISGLIGGVLYDNEVYFMGSRVLKGVDGNAGDALGSMEVPYAFGWTELSIQTDRGKDENSTSYKYAEVAKEKDVKFKPLGALLAVKLGNKQSAGNYTFTPEGFTLNSNAWFDQGSFNLDTDIPTTDAHKVLPTWNESYSCAGTMYYTFASGHEPGTIAANDVLKKTHYVWVMPNRNMPATAQVSVLFKGKSSRPETATYKDYTNTWFTDYTPKAAQGKVIEGKIHALTANASYRLSIPIEYVTEHNLAGGEGLTYVVEPGSTYIYQLHSAAFGGVQPPGVTGDLRFADNHDNNQSGYYNWYKVVGRHDATYNPNTKNLQTEIDNTFGPDKYYVPTKDQWSAIFPNDWYYWGSSRSKVNKYETGAIHSGNNIFRFSSLADNSRSFSLDEATDDATIYAIRFKPFSNCGGASAESYDPTTNQRSARIFYPHLTDNRMRCAYRYRRVGGRKSWEERTNRNFTNRLIIDVVYLGEELNPTDLATISDDAWWSSREAEGKIITRVFPASARLYPSRSQPGISGGIRFLGNELDYLSVTQTSLNSAASVGMDYGDMYDTGNVLLDLGVPVRLFSHRSLRD